MAGPTTKAAVVPPFTEFSKLYDQLTALLDNIKNAAPQGKSLPDSAHAEPGTTDTGAKAYGEALSGVTKYTKDADNNVVSTEKVSKSVQDIIKPVTDALSPTQVGYFSGLNFTDPKDVDKQRTDVVHALQTAWDASASKYMKNAQSDGDSLRPKLLARLQEFDTAVQTLGKTPVKPDQ